MVKSVVKNDSLIIDIGDELLALSSMHGIRRARFIVFNYVNKSFSVDDIVSYSEEKANSLGLDPEKTLILITAVKKGEYIRLENKNAILYATIGLSPPVCIEQDKLYDAPRAGTINLVVISKEPLSESALLDLFRVVTEAKCVSSSMLGLRCNSRSVGTVTDAIVVAARISNNARRWAGMATRIGNSVARLVQDAIMIGDKREISEKLKGFLGMSIGELVDEALVVYRTAPVPGVSEQYVRSRLYELFEKLLRDPNVWSFIIASRELDLYGVSGLIPGLSRDEFLSDTKRIVADEALEVALANYISGFRGLLASYWVDREKHNLGLRIAELPVFEDDIAAALIGSILSRLYDELLGTGV